MQNFKDLEQLFLGPLKFSIAQNQPQCEHLNGRVIIDIFLKKQKYLGGIFQ